MQGKRNLGRLNRLTALILALVWPGAGLVAVVAGFLRDRWLLLTVGLFAAVYGILWLRVFARSRLLSWREFVAPWRSAARAPSEVKSRSMRS
jgi:hypothetical protein